MNSARIKKYVPTAVAAVGTAVFLASGPAALAASENWNSRSDPLIAWEDGDRQALAYGTAYTKEGSMKNHTWYRDPRAGGDDVYTETSYSVYVQEVSGDWGWRDRCCKDQSARDDSGDWIDQYDAYYYAHIDSIERGRVYYKVCEDQSWSPDACSVNPFITFRF